MFDAKDKKPVSIGDYITTVKALRKALDGKETYGRWSGFIRQCFKDKMAAPDCAAKIVAKAMAEEAERIRDDQAWEA